MGYDAIVAAVRNARTRDRIVVLESVSDQEVDALYRTAHALVMPSRYEGFGFTPLEAMRRDCPVVASDIPAIVEATAGAALLVPDAAVDKDAAVDAVAAAGFDWDAQHLDKWLDNPRGFMPGTKMTFAGLHDPKDRIDLIAYLKVETGYKPPNG